MLSKPKDAIMTSSNRFGQLFPPALFLIVGLFLSSFWSPDPVLFITALTVAGGCFAWLIIATIDAVKTSRVEP